MSTVQSDTTFAHWVEIDVLQLRELWTV